MPSDADGNTCSVADKTYRYGPYLRQGIPAEPINNDATIAFTKTGAAIAPAAAGTGWAYDAVSGQFIMNSALEDSNKKAYSSH